MMTESETELNAHSNISTIKSTSNEVSSDKPPCCSAQELEDGKCINDQKDALPKHQLTSTKQQNLMETVYDNNADHSLSNVEPDPSLIPATNEEEEKKISFFAKYLTIWVALAMACGTLLGSLVPAIPEALEKATVYEIWIPGAVLVWLMVYPMALGVRMDKLSKVHTNPAGLCLTTVINWAVQPFLMYALAVLFFNVVFQSFLDPQTREEFIAGAVILGGSPCTAMVFVWSALANGDPNYTFAQVVLNDIILLFLYVPTTQLLLSVSNISLPWGTVFLSVFLFVVVPFGFGFLTHVIVLRKSNPKGEESLQRIQAFFQPVSEAALILMVASIFLSQADTITANPIHVLMIVVPLLLQTTIVFVLTYGLAYFFCLPHSIAGPAAFIGSSNFFELAVALAITVYGPDSGAVLVACCGVLVEVPIMLLEVSVVNRSKVRYDNHLTDEACRCHKVADDSNRTVDAS